MPMKLRKKYKRRRKTRKKTKRKRKMRKTKRKRGGAKKNFKKNLLHNIEKKEKKLKPMVNSLISKYYKGKKKMSYSVLKKIIENSENKVLEKVGKEVKEIMSMRKSVMKGGADDDGLDVIPFAISAFSFCFLVCFMLYGLLSFFDAHISRFYIMSQGGYQQMVERTGWREADNEIDRNIKKIKREIAFLFFIICIKSSINNYYEAQERMRQFRLLSPLQQQRIMIEHQERINRQNAELEQFNEELDEVRDFWNRMRGYTNLNRNLDVQRMIRDIRSNHNMGESKEEGKE